MKHWVRYFICIIYISLHNLKMSYFKDKEIESHTSIGWKKLQWSSWSSDVTTKMDITDSLPHCMNMSLCPSRSGNKCLFPTTWDSFVTVWQIEHSKSNVLRLWGPDWWGLIVFVFILVRQWLWEVHLYHGHERLHQPYSNCHGQHCMKRIWAIPTSPTQIAKSWVMEGKDIFLSYCTKFWRVLLYSNSTDNYWVGQKVHIFPHNKSHFFIFTNNFIDLNILRMSAICHEV